MLLSCNAGRDIIDDSDISDKVRVSFYLSGSDISSLTRSFSGVTEESGDIYENTIDFRQVEIFLCPDETTALKIERVDIFQSSENISVYHVLGDIELPVEYINRDIRYRIEVFANCGTDINYDRRGELQFWYNAGEFNPSAGTNKKYIPMWGASTQILNLKLGEQTKLDDIIVIRSLAKTRVSLSESVAAEGYRIESLRLSRINSSGYCLPYNYASTSTTGSIPENIYIPSNVQQHQNVNLSDNDGEWFVYMPEMASTSDLQFEIYIRDSDNSQKNYKFSFNPDDNSYFRKIIRNNIYEFRITKIRDEKVDVESGIIDWLVNRTEIWWKPDIDNYDITPNTAQQITPSVSYIDFKFRLDLNYGSAPDNVTGDILYGAVWTATLTNGLDFKFVEEDLGTGKKSVSKGIARSEPYTIRVRATKSDFDEIRSTELFITVDGVKLKIGENNGEYITVTQQSY